VRVYKIYNKLLVTPKTDAVGISTITLNVSDGDGGDINTTFNLTVGDQITLNLDISNIALDEHNITSIEYIGKNGNVENFIIAEDENITDGNNSIPFRVSNIGSDYALKFNLLNGKSYWFNHTDHKLYETFVDDINFVKTTDSNINITLDALSSNWLFAPDITLPTISKIYDRYRLVNEAVSFKIPFSIDDSSQSDLILEISPASSDLLSYTLTTSTGDITSYPTTIPYSTYSNDINLTITPNANETGIVELILSTTDASSNTTDRVFQVVIDKQQYDDISVKETQSTYDTVAALNVNVTDNRYILRSGIDSNTDGSTYDKVGYNKLTVDSNSILIEDKIIDIDGLVTHTSEISDIPNTIQFDTIIDNIATSTLYAQNNTPFTFSNTNSISQKSLIKYNTEKLEIDDNYFNDDTTFSSMSLFVDLLTTNETSYGLIRNKDKSKIITLDTDGNLIERDENQTITNYNAGSWSTGEVDGYEILIVNPNSSDYKQESAFILDTIDNKIKSAQYYAAGDIYSHILLNQEAKNELYNSISPNPKIATPIVDGYTYISLPNTKTLCTSDLQVDNTSLCDQNNTINSIFGSNILLKYEENWQYWDSNADINALYRMNKFSTIGPLDGVIVKATSAQTLYIPYNNDADTINTYEGMSSGQWYLISNNKEQTIQEIVIATTISSKVIEYILIFRDNIWNIYPSANYNSSITKMSDSSVIKRFESYWIIFK